MKEENESVSLAFNDIDQGGSSDKVYHLALEKKGGGFTVTAQYGRRGSALAIDCKTKNGPLPYAEAKQIFDRVEREKRNKGYRDTGASAPAVPEISGRVPAFAVDVEPHAQELLEEVSAQPVIEHLLRSDDYWMQDKSDGHSRGAVKAPNGTIYGLNKTGGRVPLPAALVATLEQIKLTHFQIDAELVGERLVCRDMLVAGADISKLPYADRFRHLVAVCFGLASNVLVVETWEGESNKRAALAEAQKQHREGVVFKMKRAPHRAGRNGQHKKFKFVKTCSVIAGTPRAKGKDSVEIHLFDEVGILRRVGTVSLIGKAKIKKGDVLEVRYLYAFPSRMLCQARFDRVRVDVKPKECTMAQLIYKREEGQ